jgi:hypothetical protein
LRDHFQLNLSLTPLTRWLNLNTFQCYDGAIMTSRMQITMDDGLRNRAARKAKASGISISEFVRRAVEKEAGQAMPNVDVTAVFDLGRAEKPSNISQGKKKMLAEALAGKLAR